MPLTTSFISPLSCFPLARFTWWADNEKVQDLLDPSATDLRVRESPKLGVHITGLTKKEVNSGGAVMRVLNNGFRNRTVNISCTTVRMKKDFPQMSLVETFVTVWIGCIDALQRRIVTLARNLCDQHYAALSARRVRRKDAESEYHKSRRFGWIWTIRHGGKLREATQRFEF